MPYENIPHVGATIVDQNLRQSVTSSQPKILVLGTATSGKSYELFNIANIREAETEFGAGTELLKKVHELNAQGADNLAVMRIGGRQGEFVFTDSASNTLTIVPAYRDNEILNRYALVVDPSSGTNRYLIRDLIDQTWVHDSEEILAINEGIVKITDTGIDLFTVGTIADGDSNTALADLVTGDFTVGGTATATSVATTDGTDGTGVSLMERYAALNEAYDLLDFEDADFVIPVGVYIDDNNIAVQEDDAPSIIFSSLPVPNAVNDALGYVWQYHYRGKIYTYFVDSTTYFSDLGSASVSTATVNTDLVISTLSKGAWGDNVTIEINATGAAGPTASVTIADEAIAILVTDDGTAANSAAVTVINTALEAAGLGDRIEASSGGATLLSTVPATNLSGGNGGSVLTHAELTGDKCVPAAVQTRFEAGVDAELREVNFAHQLATFAHRASTCWKALMGFISVKKPTQFDRCSLAAWIGVPPTYSTIGLVSAIDSAADNGTGLLGQKLLAGHSESGAGYRSHLVTEGDTTDSYANGGIILTKGASLPNGTIDRSYGINSADEALDSGGSPIDIGKHICITYEWPIHTNSYNGGSTYRGSYECVLAGKLSIMPENEEPIGNNGVVTNVTQRSKILIPQMNYLARHRMHGMRFENGLGWINVGSKTAAHPDSDYSDISTIRTFNRTLAGLRNIGKRVLGKAYTSERVMSLQASIDGYLKSETNNGWNNGASAELRFTQQERIIGKLRIILRLTPPFSIRQIEVEVTLVADESEL